MTLPILTVIGATGAQGSSIVDTALKSGHYKVRAITRNTSSDRAKDLIKRGCEVMSADLNNENSLKEAFEVYRSCSFHMILCTLRYLTLTIQRVQQPSTP